MSNEQPEAKSLSAKLEEQSANTAEAERSQRIRELETLSSKYTETRQLFAGGVVTMALMLLAGLVFIGLGVQLMGKEGTTWLLSLGLGAVLIAVTVPFFARLKKPVLTLGSDGIVIRDGEIILPWTAIADFDFNTTGLLFVTTGTTLWIYLQQDTPAPKIGFGRQVRYNAKQHRIVLNVIKFAGLNGNALAELFGGYLQAGHARAALRDM